MPSLLVWGGCAAPALVQPTPTSEEAQADSAPTSPVLIADAAMIRQAALDSGYSTSEASRIEQSVIRARPEDRALLIQLIYGQLNRQQTPNLPPSTGSTAARQVAASRADTLSANPAGRAGSRTAPAQTSRPVVPASHNVHLRDDDPAGHDRPLARSQPSTAARSGAAEEPPIVLDRDGGSTASAPRELGVTADRPPEPSLATRMRMSDSTATSSAIPRSRTDQASTTDDTTTNDWQRLPSIAANTAAQLDADADHTDGAPKSEEEDDNASWRRQLRVAAARLHRELNASERIDPLDESRLRACLSLLQLVAADSEQAMASLEGLDDHELEFWRQTIMGLDILMDADEIPRLRHRVENASSHLQSGMAALANLGPLMLENAAFVDEVTSYGAYHEIGKRGFAPGERALLYVEVSNFAVEEISIADQRDSRSARRRAEQVPQYECDLLGRYEILDADQRVVESRALGVTRDRWRRQRRDFFIAYDFVFPEIPAGNYTFELTIEDRKGNKFGHAAIDFQLR
jgi:hypothetical protein